MKTRLEFLKTSALLGGLLICPKLALAKESAPTEKWFSISLAQWSLHRAFKAGELNSDDFAQIAHRDYGIDGIEYVNQFYREKASDAYWGEMRKRADSEGVKSVLIMVDGEGRLGDPDDGKRAKAVTNHQKWIDAASALGCHSIRVNAGSSGTYAEQQKRAIDGLRRLTELAEPSNINVIVENHGGLSSNGSWLSSVIKGVDHANCGTLPDFGNFVINRKTGESYDRYKGMKELIPFAKGVSAKSHDFDSDGNEVNTDFARVMKIVKESGYRGYVGVEYEGKQLSEPDGIRATKKLLQSLGGR